MLARRSIAILAVIGIGLILGWARPAAATVFLTGDYIQLPIDSTDLRGRFMAEGNASGALYNPAGTGGATGRDFWRAGSPIYNYTIAANASQFTANGIGWAVPPIVADTSSGSINSATISGQPLSGLSFTRVVTFADADQFVVISDTLSNTGTGSVNQVATLDNTDPDQDSPSTFDTANDVVTVQVANDFAVATGPVSGLTLGFGSASALRVVDCSGFDNTNPYPIIASPDDPNGAEDDIGLNIAFAYGTLPSGASQTAIWFMVFAPDKASAIATYAQATGCGDAVLGVGEECDDGGTANGDGCDAACRVEPCFTCSGMPSSCAPVAAGTACDDGLFCNGSDTCSAAGCTLHGGDPCSGGGDCNETCNENLNSCAAPPGAPCTDDGNPCTDDTCTVAGACVHPTNFGVPCDDDVFCNGLDACAGGGCVLHDGDPCTFIECSTLCDETSDICDPTAAGTPCTSDGNECTADACDGSGSCAHPGLPAGTACASDGNQCTGDACNGAGACVHPPLADGTGCNDLDACTQLDQCAGGACVGADPVVCTAPLCYRPGECDASSGACTTCPAGYSSAGGGCQKTYAIGPSSLDGLSIFCGDGSARFDCAPSQFGFHWTDAGGDGVGPVSRVDVSFNSGVDCSDSPHSVSLNGAPIGVYTTTASACGCNPPVFARVFDDVDTATYVKGGANSVAISRADCAGLSRDVDGSYGYVIVTYADPGPLLAPQTGCRQAGKSRFRYRNGSGDVQDRVLWKWGAGEATRPDEFADPTASADYRMCVFAESGSGPVLLLGVEVAADATRWKATGGKGFKYRDAAGTADGVTGMLLRGGVAGRPKVMVKGKGAALDDPALPLAVDLSAVRVQLTNTANGVCWESAFPLSSITADDQRIKANVR